MLVAGYKYILGCSGRGLQEIRRENSKIVNGWLCSDGRVLCVRVGQGVGVFRGCGYWHVGDARWPCGVLWSLGRTAGERCVWLVLCRAGWLTGGVEHFNIIQSDVPICTGLVKSGLEDQLDTNYNAWIAKGLTLTPQTWRIGWAHNNARK